MSDVKWIKLNTNMVDNRKIKRIRRLPDGNNIVLFWVLLLTKAGESNQRGALIFLEDMPYTVDDLADEFDFSHDFVKFALQTLEKLNMIEIYEDIIYIKNWQKYQNIEGMERVRKLNAERNKRYRERKKQKQLIQSDVSVTSRDGTDRELELDIDIERDKESNTVSRELELFNYYLSKNIVQHKKFTSHMRSKAKTALREHSLEDLKEVIDNYVAVFESDDHFFNTKYTFVDILRPKDITQFSTEANPLEKFRSFDKKNGAIENGKTNYGDSVGVHGVQLYK